MLIHYLDCVKGPLSVQQMPLVLLLGSESFLCLLEAGSVPQMLQNQGMRHLTPYLSYLPVHTCITPRFSILGGGDHPPIGTFSEHVVVESHQVIEAPDYIDDVHIAAWPVAGLTAWR